MRISALFPTACAIVAFVLGMLCLFAGHKKNFMEDYNILTLNTSTLGHNLIPTTTTSTGATATATSVGSLFSSIIQKANATVQGIENEIEGDIDDVIGDVADKLAAEIGIKQWYSMHLMDYCEGTFTPNATASGASKNISKCSNQTAMYHFDIAQVISGELQVGKLKLNLSDIDWPDDIQDGLNDLSTAVDATFVLYAIGIAAAGLAIITSLLAVFLNGSRLISFGNWGIAGLSFAAFLIASVIVTIIQKKAVHLINKYGNDIGLYASRGTKFLIITWVAVAVMFLATMAWVVEFCIGRKNKHREYTEKGSHGGGWMSRRKRTREASLRRSGV